MPTSAFQGPSSWREWTRAPAPHSASVSLASDDGEVRHGLLSPPRLMAGKRAPRFSLVLMLSRTPGVADESIRPLLVSSYLGMEVDYRLPPDLAQRLPARPLFARHAEIELRGATSSGPALAATKAPLLHGALHAHLGRDDTLAVLDALDGRPGDLQLRARVAFMASAPGDCFALRLSAAGLWDRLEAVAVDGTVSDMALRQVFDALGVDPQAFGAFAHLCRVLFVPAPDTATHCLGRRPAPGSTRIETAWRTPLLRHMEWRCGLDELLGQALSAADREACVRVVGPSLDLDAPKGPNLLVGDTARGTRSSMAQTAMLAGTRIQSVSAALQPSHQEQPTAHLLATQAMPISQSAATVSNFVLPQALYQDLSEAEASLPVVGDLQAPLLPDRHDAGLRWYLPSLQLVRPRPNQAADDSPFLFDLRKIGTTSSGQSAIRAQIRFTLELAPSALSASAMADAPRLRHRMIEPVAPCATLTVPFVDEASGELRRASYPGVVTRTEQRFVVTIELLNDAARTAYGSLSTHDFQGEPARLEFAFQFAAWHPVPVPPVLNFGGKISHAVFLRRQRGDDPGIAISVGGRETSFRPAMAHVAPLNLGLAGRIETSQAALALPARIGYAQRTTIRRMSLDAFFPCDELGAFYREQQGAQMVAIGCVDSYRLGQASAHRYQEMPALNETSFRVFRNLQQPGRFLVLPLSYAVTRHAPSTGERAYRPALIVYAVLDAEHPERSRIRFEAMLAPAIDPHAWRNLQRRLLDEAQSPVLDLPNVMSVDTEFRWNLTSAPPVDVSTSCTPEGLHAALATDLSSALLLKLVIENTGLSGTVRFKLEDDTVLSSALSMQLGTLTGPWPGGPVQVECEGRGEGSRVRLTNRVDVDLAIHDVHLFDGAAEPVRIPVDSVLPPAASRELAAPPAPCTDATASFVPMGGRPSFEEVRATIEEIQCNVVFVDLVNYENHGLTQLEIEARLQGVPGVSAVPMAERRGAVGAFSGTYAQFHSAIVARMPSDQTPNLFRDGVVDAAFEAQRPFAIGESNGGGGGGGSAGSLSISGPASFTNGPTPVGFAITVPPGHYFAVEVATDASLFNAAANGSRRQLGNFHASWSVTPFLQGSVYQVPADAWNRLRAGASQLYYRVWCSASATAWVSHQVSTPDAAALDAPSVSLTAVSNPLPSTGSPSITAPSSLPDNGALRFQVDPGPGRYHAVEITTNPWYFTAQYSAQRNDSNFYGSWRTTPFAGAALYPASFEPPADALNRLRANASNGRLYYRMWWTESPTQWLNHGCTTPDSVGQTAPSVALTRDT